MSDLDLILFTLLAVAGFIALANLIAILAMKPAKGV